MSGSTGPDEIFVAFLERNVKKSPVAGSVSSIVRYSSFVQPELDWYGISVDPEAVTYIIPSRNGYNAILVYCAPLLVKLYAY